MQKKHCFFSRSKKTLFFLAAILPATPALAADDPLFPADGSTLYIDRTNRPNPLQQEVDPSYAFHAKSARMRLKRAIYFLLLARKEYKLYANHLRTLDIKTDPHSLERLESLILALDNELEPPEKRNPLANVVTNMPEVSVAVDPDTREIVTSSPKRPFDDLPKLFDGLAPPSRRLPHATVPNPAPVVGSVGAPAPKPAPTTHRSPQHAAPASSTPAAGLSGLPLIPPYQPKHDASTCPTCGPGTPDLKMGGG